MSIWKIIVTFFTKTETLKEEFLKTIAEEIEETPEEVKNVVRTAKKLKTDTVKPAKAKKTSVAKNR